MARHAEFSTHCYERGGYTIYVNRPFGLSYERWRERVVEALNMVYGGRTRLARSANSANAGFPMDDIDTIKAMFAVNAEAARLRDREWREELMTQEWQTVTGPGGEPVEVPLVPTVKPIRVQVRDAALRTIEALYGLDTEIGRRLVLDVILEMGFNALSDEAVMALRERHRTEEEHQVNAALRKHRSLKTPT